MNRRNRNEPIRIAFIIDEFGTGGTERQLKYLLEGLDKKKFKTTLFLLRGNANHPFKPCNIEILGLNVGSLFSLSGVIKLLRFSYHLRKHNFQIIQTFFFDSAFFGILAAKIAKVDSIIISVRDLLFWATPFYYIIYKKLMRMADAIVVNSNAIKNHIEKLIKNKSIKVIHNGISSTFDFGSNFYEERFLLNQHNISTTLPIITIVSNCNRRVKRVDLFIDAIPLVIKQYTAFFLIVGDGYLRSELENRANELGVQKYVKFLGECHDVKAILKKSTMAINTSDSEGFSNSIMEAMNFSLPVVATNIAANKELIIDGETGLLFIPGSTEDLAKKVIRLLQNKKLSVEMGNRAKERIKNNFTIERMIVQYEFFYNQLIKKDKQ
jgi:glycosyltransferase involved in cell wall biosynthesis